MLLLQIEDGLHSEDFLFAFDSELAVVLVHNSSDDPKPQAVVLALFSGAVDLSLIHI